MSLGLKLLPFNGNNFSHEVISVELYDGLFEQIQQIKQLEVDAGFNSYLSRNDDFEEPHYGETLETPYGGALTYCKAKDLKKLGIPGAAGAYVMALSDDTKIALYWD